MRSPSRFGSRLTRCLRSHASGAGSQRASRFARRLSGSARRAARSRGRVGLVRELREEHLVGAGVALGQEPGAATRAVEPPLTLHSRNVLAEVVVPVQLALRGRRPRARIDLPAKSEVGHLARAAVGTGEDVGHVRALEDGGQLKQIGTKPQGGWFRSCDEAENGAWPGNNAGNTVGAPRRWPVVERLCKLEKGCG